jgi:hypothetical protein
MKHPEMHAALDGLLDPVDACRLPDLPNFGIFYLNVPNAAALIVEDLKRSGRYSFEVEEAGGESRAEGEKRLERRIAGFTADLELRLLNAVERGILRSCGRSRTLEDFLRRGNQQHVPEYTNIHG